MPHIIIECSEKILNLKSPEAIMHEVFEAAETTGLFAKGDIKIRLNTYIHFDTAGSKSDFVHIIAYIMEGRTNEQKKKFSAMTVSKLKDFFPEVHYISMDVRDINRAAYSNLSTLNQ